MAHNEGFAVPAKSSFVFNLLSPFNSTFKPSGKEETPSTAKHGRILKNPKPLPPGVCAAIDKSPAQVIFS
jgi:hypothetical protein